MIVQGPVKEQQPDGMSHGGGGGFREISGAVNFMWEPSRFKLAANFPHKSRGFREIGTCR